MGEAEIARLRAANSAPLVAPFPAQAPPLPAVTEALSPAHIPLPVPIPEPVYYAEPEQDVRSRTSSPAYAYSHSQSHSPSPEAVVLPSAVHPAHHVAQTAPAPEEVRAAVLKACSRAPLFTRPAPPVDIVPLPLSVATMTPFPVPPSPPALLGFSSLSSDPLSLSLSLSPPDLLVVVPSFGPFRLFFLSLGFPSVPRVYSLLLPYFPSPFPLSHPVCFCFCSLCSLPLQAGKTVSNVGVLDGSLYLYLYLFLFSCGSSKPANVIDLFF